MGGLTEITIYSTSSLQDIYDNLPFIEKTGDGNQLLQDVSLYLGIKYLTFRVGLCYPPSHSIFLLYETDIPVLHEKLVIFLQILQIKYCWKLLVLILFVILFYFLMFIYYYYFFVCIFRVKNFGDQIWDKIASSP